MKHAAAVIGNPVARSLSPEIFSKISGSDLPYLLLDIESRDLKKAFNFFSHNPYFIGWNVTIPHKEKIFKLARFASTEAKLAGAANVVFFGKGSTKVYNTDIFGIMQTLKEAKCQLTEGEVVLYGAGGAARAVAVALAQLKAKKIWVVNRSRARAENFCKNFNKKFKHSKFLATLPPPKTFIQLHVNATPVSPKLLKTIQSRKINKKPPALAFDLVYRPKMTTFLKKAARQGLQTVNGLDMLCWQAIKTWEIWFGRIKPAQQVQLKKSVKRHLIKVMERVK